MISILCDAEKQESLATLLYEETSTLGIRIRHVERECMERESVAVVTAFGTVDIKLGRVGDRVVNAMPEYEQIRIAALENRVAFRVVAEAAMAEFNRANSTSKAKAQG